MESMARLTCSSLARRLTAAFFAAVILGMSAAFVGDDAGHLRAELPDRPAALPVRGFYMPSYDVVALVERSAVECSPRAGSECIARGAGRARSGTRRNEEWHGRDSISEDPWRPHRHAARRPGTSA
jgi:hypothetical protein